MRRILVALAIAAILAGCVSDIPSSSHPGNDSRLDREDAADAVMLSWIKLNQEERSRLCSDYASDPEGVVRGFSLEIDENWGDWEMTLELIRTALSERLEEKC